MKIILRKTKLILSKNDLDSLIENAQIQLWTWGRWRKWRELAMDGELALEGKGRPIWSVSIFE